MEYKKLSVLLSLFSLGLSSCDNVGGNQGTQGSQGRNSSIKSAPVGTLATLGEPAYVKSKTGIRNAFSAIDPSKVRVTLGTFEQNYEGSVVASSSITAASLFAGVTVGGGYGLLKASLSTEYANEQQKSNKGITLMYSSVTMMPVNITIPTADYLTANAKSLKDKPESFAAEYGTGYISQVDIGNKFTILYSLSSEDAKTNEDLKVAADLSYGDFANFAARMQKTDKSEKSQIRVDLKVEVNGQSVQIDKLPELNLDDLVGSSRALLNFVIATQNNASKKFDQTIEKFAATSQNLNDFFNVFGSTGLADNNLFGLDKIKFNNYPGMGTPSEAEKVEQQQEILGNISKSAMLSGDSSFIKILTGNNIVSNIIENSSDFAGVIQNIGYYTSVNAALINTTFINELLNACFENGSIAECKQYLATTKIKPTGQASLTIDEYFKKLNGSGNERLFSMKGFYSDLDPNLANYFWIELKDKNNQDILVPLNLNTRTSNKCVAPITPKTREQVGTLYTGLSDGIQATLFPDVLTGINNTGTIVDDDGIFHGVTVMARVAVKELSFNPSDIVLYPVYDSKGNISSVRREAPSMNGIQRRGNPYNGTYSCQKEIRWDRITFKNIEYTHCDDKFSDFNGLNFFKSASNKALLSEALEKSGNRAIVNHGYNLGQTLGAQDSVCNSIGDYELTKDKPFCTEDNKQCLEIDKITGEFKYVDSFNRMSTVLGPKVDNLLAYRIISRMDAVNDWERYAGFDVYTEDTNQNIKYVDRTTTNNVLALDQKGILKGIIDTSIYDNSGSDSETVTKEVWVNQPNIDFHLHYNNPFLKDDMYAFTIDPQQNEVEGPYTLTDDSTTWNWDDENEIRKTPLITVKNARDAYGNIHKLKFHVINRDRGYMNHIIYYYKNQNHTLLTLRMDDESFRSLLPYQTYYVDIPLRFNSGEFVDPGLNRGYHFKKFVYHLIIHTEKDR